MANHNPDEFGNLLRALLSEPRQYFGQPLAPGHRDALRYVLSGSPEDRQAALGHGRPDLPDELLPLGFQGYPPCLIGAFSERLLEVLLLGNCHSNIRDWVSPITSNDLLQHFERTSDRLAIPRAELSAIVITTLPSKGEIAEAWLLGQKDSVFQSALRRIRSDGGLQCLFRYAFATDPARLAALVLPVVKRPQVFEGRVALALLSVTPTYTAQVKARWLSLPPAAKLDWGLRLELAVKDTGIFAREIEDTLRTTLETPSFFATPQAGWFAGVALKRFGSRFSGAIRKGILGSAKPTALIRGIGSLGRESADESTLDEAAKILASVQGHFASDEEVSRSLSEALVSLKGER